MIGMSLIRNYLQTLRFLKLKKMTEVTNWHSFLSFIKQNFLEQNHDKKEKPVQKY